MDRDNSNPKPVATSTAVTSIDLVSKIKVRRYDCKWVIENFRFCCTDDLDFGVDDSMQSTSFETDGFEWSLDLFPKYTFENSYLSVRLFSTTNDEDLFDKLDKLEATICIINNKKEEVCMQKKMIKETELINQGVIFTNIVKKNDLYDENNGLMQNNQLTLLCKIFINENVFISMNKDIEKAINERRLVDLCSFGKLLRDRKFSDVRIFVEDKTFYAHKAILAVRSPVFSAMLTHNMKEKNESKIVISDVDAEIVELMLTFIYSGSIDRKIIEAFTSKLYAVADKYQLEGLKMLCEQVLIDKLDIDNMAEVLKLVDKYGSETLCEASLKFLRKKRIVLAEKHRFDPCFESLSSVFLKRVIKNLMEML